MSFTAAAMGTLPVPTVDTTLVRVSMTVTASLFGVWQVEQTARLVEGRIPLMKARQFNSCRLVGDAIDDGQEVELVADEVDLVGLDVHRERIGKAAYALPLRVLTTTPLGPSVTPTSAPTATAEMQ